MISSCEVSRRVESLTVSDAEVEHGVAGHGTDVDPFPACKEGEVSSAEASGVSRLT